MDKARLVDYFEKLGLQPKVAEIYLALQAKSPQSISQISRSASVERTRIYRLLGELKDSGLVEERVDYKRKLYQSAPLTNLRGLLTKREQQIDSMKAELDFLEQSFKPQQAGDISTTVKFYNGPDGIRQSQWNILRGTSDVFTILHRQVPDAIGNNSFMAWVEEWNKRPDRSIRQVYGVDFASERDAWKAKYPDFPGINGYSERAVDPEFYKISHGLEIYDDTVVFYNWVGDDVYAIEVINTSIADSQRQLFEILWNHSR